MIVAFDIGSRNFAFSMKNNGVFETIENCNLFEEKMTKTDLNKLKKDELILLGKSLKLDFSIISKNDLVNLIFLKRKNPKKQDVCSALISCLDRFSESWINCSIFLIERQMTVNRQALKISHFLEMYLKKTFPSKRVINYSASLKTIGLGAEGLKTKLERKKWTTNFSSQFLKGPILSKFEKMTKKDDIADTICMIESFEKKMQLLG